MQYLEALTCALALTFLSTPCLYRLQLRGYRLSFAYFSILSEDYYVLLVSFQLFALLLYFLSIELGWLIWLFVAITFALGVVVNVFLRRQKVTLKYTRRIIRQLCVTVITYFLLALLIPAEFCLCLIPFITIIPYYICAPIEKVVACYYISKAKCKLEKSSAIRIGITGSYGKTSTKLILARLLPQAICTPNSYNTLLGIAKFINNTDIAEYKYIIFEMGARKKGDIAKICNFVKPQHAILTGITEQHLQTFKTLDNIIATKRELPDSLPQNGICVTSDNIYTRNLTLACRKVIVGEKDCDYTYSAVLGQDGASMTVNCGENKQVFHTNLIGYANAQDVAMAYALAQELSIEVSKVNLSTIPQIPHRMELIKTKSFDILDDSYNASIEGVKAINKTLSALTCKKVVISQGIVEGGDKERQLNIEVGKLLGECCDCVYTLGRNAKNIAFGVASVGKDVKIVSSLEEAVEKVSHLLKVGDLLIFQNDIPEGV